MKYKAIFFAIIISVAAFFVLTIKLSSDKIPNKPKLVIGIVIDQMRFDYVYKYWDKFGNDGFKRLMRQGYNCRNVNYNYMPTFTGPGHTAIYTGTTPSINGIISNNWFDRKMDTTVYCVQDDNEKGVGSDAEEGKRSPQRMLATTIGDQLHLSDNMQSKVIGISLKDRAAILPAGHTANGAYWYDGSTGNFITSTFYMDALPKWVNDFNAKKIPATYLSKPWNTLLPIDQYTASITDNNNYEGLFSGETKPVFPHDLPKLASANGNLGLITSTPFGNSLLEDFAEATLTSEQLGKGKMTDFLAISFSSTDYIGHKYGPQSVEVEDCYLRLDKELADFFHFLDSYIGKNNVLVFLTADHGAVETPQYLSDKKIPSGYFDDETAMQILKYSLQRTYGDTLVLAYQNDQVFLDRKTIASKGLNKTEVENYVANFLMGFNGVESCMTATELQQNEFLQTPKKQVQNGYNEQRSGDVCVILQPCWFGEWPKHTGTTHGAPWSYDTHVPLYFWGWKIKNGSSDDAHNITDIAPTICSLLNIQFTDGCTGVPIENILK